MNPSHNVRPRIDFKNGTLGLAKIDPLGNGGQGAVLYATNVIVPAYKDNKTTELQVAACQILVPHSNGKDLWLVVPMVAVATRESPCETWVFPVSSAGIDTSRKVKSPTSFRRMFVSTPVVNPPNDYTGEVKSNTDISRIAYVGGNRGRVAVYDFDASTGVLSNEREFSNSLYWKDSASVLDSTREDTFDRYSINPHGIEFSPDGTKIYVTNIQMNGIGIIPPFNEFNPDSARGELVQYDITLPTAEAIRASKQVIVPMSYTNRFGGMQLAPDGKIYIAQRELPFVSCIENPNARGTACGFTRNAVELLPGTRCGEGFPFVMANTLSKNLRVLPQDVCNGDTMLISLAGGFVTDSVRWDFGDISSPSNIGYGKTGKHFYATQGAYLATATMYIGSDAQKPVSSWVYVHPRPIARASAAPQRVCEGDSVTLTATGGITATWFVGTTLDSTYIVGRGNVFTTIAATSGIYTVIVENVFGCLDTTSVTLEILASPSVKLSSDTSVCYGTSVTLSAVAVGATSYTWSSSPADVSLVPNGSMATFTASRTGQYTIRVANPNGCIRSSTINVKVLPLPSVIGRGDTTLCRPMSVQLSATGASSYVWYDPVGQTVGNGTSVSVLPRQTSRYVVMGTDSNGCRNADTVVVTLRPDVDLSITGDNISCDGAPVILVCTASSAIDESEILWLDEAGAIISRGKTLTATPSMDAVYRATLPGVGDCIDTADHVVKVGRRPVFTVSPTDTTVCAGDSVRVTASTGRMTVAVAQAGSTGIPMAESDNVGCTTTITSFIRASSPDAIVASMRDTTVDIADGHTFISIELVSSPQFLGATLTATRYRIAHRTNSVNVDSFQDAATGLPLTPNTTTASGDSTVYEITVPRSTLTEPRQAVLYLGALPLIDDDSVSAIDTKIVETVGLGPCIDSSSHSGLLTITGCGRNYYQGIRLGSPTIIRIQPNPASDVLHVHIDAGVQGAINIELVDILGRTLAQQTAEHTTSNRTTDHITFDLATLPSGIVHVVVTTPTERQCVQVVVGK